MGWHASSVRTRVARRLVVLFLVSAVIPASALALITWYNVSSYLETQSKRRMYEVSKHLGLALLSRLQQADGTLAQRVRSATGGSANGSLAPLVLDWTDASTEGVAVVDPAAWEHGTGVPDGWPAPTRGQLARLAEGRGVLLVAESREGRSLWLVRSPVPPAEGPTLAARLTPASFFEGAISDWVSEGSEALAYDTGGRLFANTARTIDVGRPAVLGAGGDDLGRG
jgi:hypothetical protein